MKGNENALEKVVRKLGELNIRLSDRSPDVVAPEYKIALEGDGSGRVHLPGLPGQVDSVDLVTFGSLKGLVGFLDAPFPEQIRMIHAGKVQE